MLIGLSVAIGVLTVLVAVLGWLHAGLRRRVGELARTACEADLLLQKRIDELGSRAGTTECDGDCRRAIRMLEQRFESLLTRVAEAAADAAGAGERCDRLHHRVAAIEMFAVRLRSYLTAAGRAPTPAAETRPEPREG